MLAQLKFYKPNTKDITRGSSLHVNPQSARKVDREGGKYNYTVGCLFLNLFRQINENKQFDYQNKIVIMLGYVETFNLLNALKNGTELKSPIFHNKNDKTSTLNVGVPSEFKGKFYTSIRIVNKHNDLENKHQYVLSEDEKASLIKYIEVAHFDMLTVDPTYIDKQ